jgi:hypothetical protein
MVRPVLSSEKSIVSKQLHIRTLVCDVNISLSIHNDVSSSSNELVVDVEPVFQPIILLLSMDNVVELLSKEELLLHEHN